MKRSAFPLVGGSASGADVTQGEGAAGIAKGQGSVATAVVGHYARDLDAPKLSLRPGDGGVEKRHGALLGVIGRDLDEGDAGGVVDADMDELPADASDPGPGLCDHPVMRWPTALNLTSFLMSMWISSPGCSRS